MKTEFEHIKIDDGSSFRVLHQRVHEQDFGWDYHYHPELEIVCVLSNSGRRHVGNHLSYYVQGDLVLIGANVPHGGFGFGAVGEHEEIVLQFKADFLGSDFLEKPEMLPIKLLFQKAQQGMAFHGKIQKVVQEQLQNLVQLPHFERLILLLQILKQLADTTEYQLLNALNTPYNFNMRDQMRLRMIYEFVEKNFVQAIDIEEVARLSNLTVPAFSAYFKKMTHQTFTDFVNEYRINYAAQLLLAGKSVADACFESGFNNVSYFGRVFKKIKKTQPSQFGMPLLAEES